jgi:transcriptional regulator with XRE-family HTH domain
MSALKKEQFLKKLGKHVIELREEKNLSQADLARACDKDRQNIERLENAKINPSAYYLYEIAQGLEIDLKELFDFE